MLHGQVKLLPARFHVVGTCQRIYGLLAISDSSRRYAASITGRAALLLG